MSVRHWLDDLKSRMSLAQNRRQRRARRVCRSAGRTLRMESLEDRSLFSMTPVASLAVGSGPEAVATADFNSDGHLDLVTANAANFSVSVWLGNGQGGFGDVKHVATGTGARPRSLAVADFDNDHNLDLATNRLNVLLGDGHGDFGPPVGPGTWGATLAAAAGDFNADGKMDLAVTYYEGTSGQGWLGVAFGDGQGDFAGGHQFELAGDYPIGLAVADLNGDTRPDVVTTHPSDGTVSVVHGNSGGTLGWGGVFDTGDSPQAVAVGDFNGDGVSDLVTAGHTVDILLDLGGGLFAAPISYAANGAGLTTAAVADFNGDGNLDVVTAAPGTGSVSVLLGVGNGTLTPPIDHFAGASPTGVAVGDFNEDGQPDVAAANAVSNSVSVLLNDGAWPGPNTIFSIGFDGNRAVRLDAFTLNPAGKCVKTS